MTEDRQLNERGNIFLKILKKFLAGISDLVNKSSNNCLHVYLLLLHIINRNKTTINSKLCEL